MPYKGSFLIIQCRTNGVVSLHCGVIQNRYNIHRIKPYTSDTNVGDIEC